jgi:methionyl-tRNA formyltransferase
VVIAAHSEELRVAAGEGHLQILEIQAEGKRPMTAREFLAGTHIEPGDRFGSHP